MNDVFKLDPNAEAFDLHTAIEESLSFLKSALFDLSNVEATAVEPATLYGLSQKVGQVMEMNAALQRKTNTPTPSENEQEAPLMLREVAEDLSGALCLINAYLETPEAKVALDARDAQATIN